ncbi:hypothetical protein [Oceanobacter mangrovi]|uniref:hypothetical protein n=1 Tax=Oceanobacter mangrovi TaxID=2862510 RepID=UPI001C8D26F8|nr:hypothetical protein [Oceanobacter mangrovi]
MKELILHIGTGKTGSSSIQHTLDSLSLKDCSFLYDMSGQTAFSNTEELIKKIDSAPKNKIIYSNEWLYRASKNIVKELAEKLMDNYKIQIIIYIRRQDEFAISAYQQKLKTKSKKFKSGAIALPEEDYPIRGNNYFTLINKWANAFGKENIKIRIFSKSTLKNGCVVQDFADITGLQIAAEQVIHKNTSMGLESLKVATLMNELGYSKGIRNKVLSSINDTVKMLPDRASAREFYKKFIPSNKRLKQEFNIESETPAIFDTDFSRYPLESQDQWTEKTANSVVSSLLKLVKQLNKDSLNSAEVETLEKATLAIESSNPKLAQELRDILDRISEK